MPDTIEPLDAQSQDAWPETDPSLLEEGRPALPAFPLQTPPGLWLRPVHRQYVGSRREKDKLPNPTACLLAPATQSLWLVPIYDAYERSFGFNHVIRF